MRRAANAAATLAIVVLALTAYLDHRTVTRYGYGHQFFAVAAWIAATAIVTGLAAFAARAEHRRGGLRASRHAAAVATAILLLMLDVAFGARILAVEGATAAGVLLAAAALIVTGAWGRPAALIVPPVSLACVALPWVAYSVVDAWRNPLPADFVPIGGMDGIGQDSNSDAAFAVWVYILGCLWIAAAQLVALFLGWIVRGLVRTTRANRAAATD